jgi:hypothetical protein
MRPTVGVAQTGARRAGQSAVDPKIFSCPELRLFVERQLISELVGACERPDPDVFGQFSDLSLARQSWDLSFFKEFGQLKRSLKSSLQKALD